jgi:hypothetical protein
VACALALGACKSSSQYVTVQVLSVGDTSGVVQLHLEVSLADTTRAFNRPDPATGALSFPKTFSVEFAHDAAGPVNIDVAALDAGQKTIAQGRGQTWLPGGADVIITLGDQPLSDLAGTYHDDAAYDGSMPEDTCHDAVKNGTETGIDCGGNCAARCPGDACQFDGDCVTARCDGMVCQLAIGPPSWRSEPSLQTPRMLLSCATGGDGSMYAIAGSPDVANLGAAAVATVERYNPSAGDTAWTTASSLASARYLSMSFSYSGKPYVAGGLATDNSTQLADLYALGASAWASKASLSTSASGGVLIDGGNGKLYLPSVANLVYDAANDTWSALDPPSPDARYVYAGARGPDGRLYVIGGATTGNTALATVQAYTIGGGWTDAPALPAARDYAAAILAPDKQLYLLGGSSGGAAWTHDVLILRLAENRWMSGQAMSATRMGGCATLSSAGRIFVMGGQDPTGTLKLVESYGPEVTLGFSTSGAGVAVPLQGVNFAANASLSIAFDDTAVRSVLATSATGTFASNFVVPPSAAPGVHVVTVIDAKAQYPVHYAYTVTP